MRGRAACRYGRISFFFSLVVGGVLYFASAGSMAAPLAACEIKEHVAFPVSYTHLTLPTILLV